MNNATRKKQDEKAYHILEHPEEYPGLFTRRKSDRKLLIYLYPSFEPHISWSLFNSSKTYWVRRVEWDHSKWFPSQNAAPYTFGCETSCSSDMAENILSSLATIKLAPLKQPEFLGIDGTIYGVKIGNYWQSCSLRWWSLPSKDWQPLADWFDETINTFETILPASNCRSN